ncbi:hypothetical protein [Amycolatopsis nalaikhensis]|uniref:MPN635 N-terminal domain-containing protein n=1 Tax=Amycolatopsis nalaikhensis TaxID=715472 RepID=A0ABY8XZE2_9PSEU|nr:hypothetical protein [Amycolatopsis sp. 2-2]WIV60978.1 hypothetical protein QP939_21435 [Amycolatopsis sp. 2-2]
MTVDGGEQYFDLNIERVLEHWPVAFAIREVIANALDEHALTGTAEPVIAEDAAGAWHVADFGRGLRYTHLTQNENDEKRRSGAVIGQFGMGLKDALAVFDRHDVRVEIRSAHGDITTRQRAKETFSDVRTLHAVIRPPADPHRAGTDVVLHGVTADDVAAAQNFFLHYSGDHLLETTSVGQVLKRVSPAAPGRIYVKGLLVAEEPNFLFSYNITDINAPLRRALNRERSNVGRSAYTDRVKAILKQCRVSGVVSPLAEDLAEFATGQLHDELSWREIAVHACTVLASQEKVVFVTPAELPGRHSPAPLRRGRRVPAGHRSAGRVGEARPAGRPDRPPVAQPEPLRRGLERQLRLHPREHRGPDAAGAFRLRTDRRGPAPRGNRPAPRRRDLGDHAP